VVNVCEEICLKFVNGRGVKTILVNEVVILHTIIQKKTVKTLKNDNFDKNSMEYTYF